MAQPRTKRTCWSQMCYGQPHGGDEADDCLWCCFPCCSRLWRWQASTTRRVGVGDGVHAADGDGNGERQRLGISASAM
eukprot:4935451-Lingulodinium_polyedra.AAC.1